MIEMVEGLHLIPEHMRESIVAWILRGEPHPEFMGSFMRAVLTNDLMGAFSSADEENASRMQRWVRFLYNHAPSECYGSLDRVKSWHERGGIEGRS